MGEGTGTCIRDSKYFHGLQTFGEHQKKETGIFEFLKHLPEAIIKKTPFSFMTVSEAADSYQPVSLLMFHHHIMGR